MLGMVMGKVIGLVMHLYCHYSERTNAAVGLTGHIYSDLVVGIFIAPLIAMIPLFAYHFRRGLM